MELKSLSLDSIGKKQVLKSDIRRLQVLAKTIAMAQVYCAETRVEFFASLSDGRKNKSKKFLAFKEKRDSRKESIYKTHQKARDIYSTWKGVGINCVDAGRFFMDLVDSDFNRLMEVSKDIENDQDLKAMFGQLKAV